MYQVIILREAEKFMTRQLPKKYYKIIADHINALQDDPFPAGAIKLKNSEYYRIRIGVYRIIYSVNQNELIIHIITMGHRKDIYNL